MTAFITADKSNVTSVDKAASYGIGTITKEDGNTGANSLGTDTVTDITTLAPSRTVTADDAPKSSGTLWAAVIEAILWGFGA